MERLKAQAKYIWCMASISWLQATSVAFLRHHRLFMSLLWLWRYIWYMATCIVTLIIINFYCPLLWLWSVSCFLRVIILIESTSHLSVHNQAIILPTVNSLELKVCIRICCKYHGYEDVIMWYHCPQDVPSPKCLLCLPSLLWDHLVWFYNMTTIDLSAGLFALFTFLLGQPYVSKAFQKTQ